MPTQAPLTLQQRWLLQVGPKQNNWQCAAAYTFRLIGSLSLPLLRQSIDEVVRRHGSLRARIVGEGEGAAMLIDDPQPYSLQSIAVSASSRSPADVDARAVAEEIYDQTMGFDAERLWGIQLLKLSDREHWLILTVHRLIGDCMSIEQVIREVRLLYAELATGSPSMLGTTPAQYADYALWQKRTAAEWALRHEAYWRERLAGTKGFQWPSDPNAPADASALVGKASCPFGSELSALVRESARKLRTLSASIMLAVYAVALWRWCEQDDFVVPFNTAGRQAEHKSVIGYFSYVLYLRVQIVGRESFRSFLSRLGNELFRALSHQDFGRIAAQRPDLLAGTLFQWITWHPDDAAAPTATAHPLSLVTERVPIRDFGEGLTIVPPGMVDMEVTFFDSADGLTAQATYRGDRFTPGTMDCFMRSLRETAENCLRDPEARIAQG